MLDAAVSALISASYIPTLETSCYETSSFGSGHDALEYQAFLEQPLAQHDDYSESGLRRWRVQESYTAFVRNCIDQGSGEVHVAKIMM